MADRESRADASSMSGLAPTYEAAPRFGVAATSGVTAKADVDVAALRRHLGRQVDHWTRAALRLGRLDDLAAPESWGRLERYLGLALRDHLRGVVDRLARRGALLVPALAAAATDGDLARVRQDLLAFRRQYLRAETTVAFYADAINTRTNTTLGSVLRACDTLAHRSMAGILEPLGHETPVTISYLEGGRGASILRANLRLWDGGALSPAAAIKIARHNLERPTALVHEAGHQVAHLVDWNRQLAQTLEAGLQGTSPALARTWGSWASEIAADAVAFAHTGYGSVLALHDVLADEPASVFLVIPGDPHPMSFLRVELGVAMCRLAWGSGPWDGLSATWRACYAGDGASAAARALVAASMPVLPLVARLTLATPQRAFRGRSLVDIVPPDRVSPRALAELELKLGPALYSSSHWIWTECLRLLAISALRAGDTGDPEARERTRPERWMLRLGGSANAA